MALNKEDIKLTVNGTALPSPVSLSFSYEDLDKDSGRDIKTQTMHRNRVRANVMKLSVEYGIQDATEVASVLSLVTAKTFTLTYPDPATGTTKSGTFYTGSRSGSFAVTGSGVIIKTLKFDLIEC